MAEAVASDQGFAEYISNPAFGMTMAKQGFNDDPDGDNLANCLVAWFSTHPGEFNAGLTALATDGTVTTFTHPHNKTAPAGVSGFYQWSPNLIDCYAGDGVAGPPGGSTVTITAGAPDRLFLRAGVTRKVS